MFLFNIFGVTGVCVKTGGRNGSWSLICVKRGFSGTCSVMSPDLEVLIAHRKLAPAGFLEDAFLMAALSALPSSGDPSSVVTLMRPSAMLGREMILLVYFYLSLLKHVLITMY